jgi:Zn-finger nucleic acid-binding protein
LATENYGKVEVDVCGSCKGLWLDADELTMILKSEKRTGLLRAFSKVLGA